MEYVESSHDYEIRFLECFGVLDNKVIYSESFHKDTTGMKMNYRIANRTDSSEGDLLVHHCELEDLSYITPIEFDNTIFTLPKLGFINTSFHTVFYERYHKKSSPSRYRRGLRSDTLNIKVISESEINKIISPYSTKNPFNNSLFMDTVHDLFFPYYFTYNEALESILNYTRLSAAVTNTLAMRYNDNTNSIELLKNNWVIGDYSKKDESFKLRTNLFVDSILEAGIKVNV